MKVSLFLRTLGVTALGLVISGQALAGLSVPSLSSRPGAAYTVYLDFGGFNYTGGWGGRTPGNVPAFSTDGDLTAFSTADTDALREAWARVAQKYTAFNVNVTTLDPAVAAGQVGSDPARQTFYGQTSRMMHTIIGGSNAWYSSGAGGVSYVGVTQSAAGSTLHTNWVFPDNLGGGNGKYVGEAAAHENGHGLSLNHQSDEATYANYIANPGLPESSVQQYSTNNMASGNGSYAPTVGVGYYSQRSTWRVGHTFFGNSSTTRTDDQWVAQDDVQTLLSNSGIGSLTEDGIGHSLATATALPTLGGTVDSRFAQGVIVPKNGAAAGPLGVDNYVSDYFAFNALGGAVSLSVNEGTQFLNPGTADPGTTLDSTLTIFDALGNTVGTGLVDATTLKKTYTGTLSVGRYYARIASRGGYASAYEPNAPYYTMGSYFLTGSGVASVPEPATLAGIAMGITFLSRRRRKRA